jgi:sodium/proline symporter
LVSNAWAGFGAAFGPVVLFSLIWPNMNRNGALAGMFVGALTVVVWGELKWLGLYELVPGFVFASIAIFIASKFGNPASDKMKSAFATMRSQSRS